MAAVAHVLGFFTYRRLGSFPGVASAGMIFPTFAMTYGLVVALILLFRIDYGRFQILSSFLLSMSWYFVLQHIADNRYGIYRLAIIPLGAVDALTDIQGVTWLSTPSPDRILGNVDGIVADLRYPFSDDWERFIADCALSGIPVYHVKQIRESLTGRVEIEHLSENTLGSLNPNQAYVKLKQVIDWLVALAVLIVLLPLFIVIAALVRLDSRGPMLFTQPRIGYRGSTFTIYKFRTMHVSANSLDDRERAMTKDGDSRITRIGGFLRKSRLDELPQILNILKGEMSWIGPRPEAVALSRWYEAELPFYAYRHIVRPGITGWAQVNQGHVTDVNDVLGKLHYDFYYIKNFSPWLDTTTFVKTVSVILTGSGAR
ncbi:sugar transferase [Pseudorhodoplanes sp.]|uniref:sugar transferase n=1 Tax=Pseudorhodoplanes sp. TaxID=1934341 RepID=UPI003D119915